MGINVIENIAAAAAIGPFKKLDVAKINTTQAPHSG